MQIQTQAAHTYAAPALTLEGTMVSVPTSYNLTLKNDKATKYGLGTASVTNPKSGKVTDVTVHCYENGHPEVGETARVEGRIVEDKMFFTALYASAPVALASEWV